MVNKKCLVCGEMKKHFAKGKCRKCYYYTGENKERHIGYLKTYREKNRDYWIQYNKERKQISNGVTI